MTPPPESTPPATVAPVVLWRDEATSCDPERWRSYKVDDFQEEWRALPVAAYTALMARIERAEALLRESRGPINFLAMVLSESQIDIAKDLLARIDAALGREGA